MSTLIDDTKKDTALLTILPGGAYRLNTSVYDTLLQSSVSLVNNIPLLSVIDSVTHKHVASIKYPMDHATLETCQGNNMAQCDIAKKTPTIRLSLTANSIFTTTQTKEYLQLNSALSNVLSIKNDGSLLLAPGVKLVPKDGSIFGLQMGVILEEKEIAQITYIMDSTISVSRDGITKNTPYITETNFSITPFSADVLAPHIL